MSKILAYYKKLLEIDSFEGMPSDWSLVNPYVQYWNRFEFFIKRYYQDGNHRDLIMALNPGRLGYNKTGIALTDENTLFTKLGYKQQSLKPEVERTATKIYSMIEEVYPRLDLFFSKYFMTNVFPFGVVADGKNVKFYKIIKIPSIMNFSINFVSETIELFNPKKILCVGKGSEKFIRQNIKDVNPIYLHHPAYTFPEKEKEKYRANLCPKSSA